jgi:hypothetical protein
MAIPPSFVGGVFAVRCDPYGGMKESGEANSPEVTAWRRTPPSFPRVVRHIVKRSSSGLAEIHRYIN